MDWKASAPFIWVDPANVTDLATTLYDAFEAYIKALIECVEEKCPGVLKTAEGLPTEAEDVQKNAESEFDALDMMKKAKAVMMTGKNVLQVKKIPAAIKAGIQGLKDDLQEIKDALDQLKADQPKLAANGKTCAAASQEKAVPCYTTIYGKVAYTEEEFQAWAAKMTEREKQRHNWNFKPEDYR